MAKIRVLVADDAVVVRKLVTEVVSADPEVEVIGVAANGRIAVAKVARLHPDVVILDVEMPEMNGLEALAEIRRARPRLPVIMFSTLTERGAAATLEALALGATDYVTKPANAGSVAAAIQRVREELLPKIRAFAGHPPRAATAGGPGVPAATASSSAASSSERPLRLAVPPASTHAPGIVAVGSSTGGPNALAEVLRELPADLQVPVVVVQHMPPVFTKLLAERLAARCSLPVAEAGHGTPLGPGRVWIAPGDHHLLVERKAGGVRLALSQAPPENSCRPAVDVLFRSAAAVYGARVLAVVLTGMGKDGLRGCEQVRAAGGRVLAQDEATSVVWGMPGFVARAGLAEQVLPLGRIGRQIVRTVREGRASPATPGQRREVTRTP